ncbi:amidase [Saccharopolyspora flava]|uniref:Aspartyl-tRNA(Asn)/glutamyl-tRNA(Gln) amidotransferase subunit A n=1 Tax=Saccharopolyspora flava TaxID=95161 RepID=A0A1I6SNM5_9PSEU|nr:amidase [Saccharopolyspora flava]SFS78408.1 aspartyl-tRNA(Asn)/glutamyl-tRNA(Gln) amidotransferase subunit A [Saccharopolyspora flava]
MSTGTQHTTGYFRGRTLAELGERLRADEIRSVDLVKAALTAIDALDGTLNAFVTVDRAGALRAAETADAELADGRDRGPLHGIPVAVKDIIDVAGLRTTMGSAHFADHVSTQDAECVTRLREAGAIIVGKTTTQEFAFGPTGDRAHNGASRNPHDSGRMTGGSSGGSGAAVAAGIVPLALGTDTGGSVRIPASLCGVAGFKPAFDAVPTGGVFPLSQTLDHVGVLAGSPADCRTGYRVLAGLRPMPRRDPGSEVRVGWIPPDLLHPTDPRVAELARTALDSDGLDVREIRPEGLDGMLRAFGAIQFSEAHAVHADRVAEAPQLFTDDVLDLLRQAGETAGWQYVRALTDRERWRAEVAALLDEVDLLAMPTTCVAAPEIDQRQVDIGGTPLPVRGSLIGLTRPWNLAGVPALSVPAGTVGGLPAGLQLVGAPGREDELFAVADGIGEALQRWRGGPRAATKDG